MPQSASTISGIPKSSDATTGSRIAIASLITTGMLSRSPDGATVHGAASTVARASSPRICSGGSSPASSTTPPSPAAAIRAASAGRWGPSPMMRQANGTPRSCSSAAADTRAGKPFLSTSRPTARTSGGTARRDPDASRNASGSTPAYFTSTEPRSTSGHRRVICSTL